MINLSPIQEVEEETSAAAARIEAAERLCRHEVDLDVDLGFPDQPRPMRASTPPPRLGDTTILSALNQSVNFLPSWMWCSLDSGIRQPMDDSEDSVESNSTVLMASLDISWASSSLDSIHTDPEPTADKPTAPSRRPPPYVAEDGSESTVSEVCSIFDASEGPCLRPARSSGKSTIISHSLKLLPDLFCCLPDTTLPEVDLTVFWNRTPREWRRIYLNRSKTNYLSAAWSRGRPRDYDAITFRSVSLYISRLLHQGIICQVKREKNFISYPFVVPKRPGERPRLTIDYGHLKDKGLYVAPKFKLVPILASPAAVSTLKEAQFFAKIDLTDAFYAMPLPKSLFRVSTFKFGGKFYQFHRLQMGLFISPFLLQMAIQALMATVAQCWVHIDDIMLWGKSLAELRNRVEKVV